MAIGKFGPLLAGRASRGHFGLTSDIARLLGVSSEVRILFVVRRVRSHNGVGGEVRNVGFRFVSQCACGLIWHRDNRKVMMETSLQQLDNWKRKTGLRSLRGIVRSWRWWRMGSEGFACWYVAERRKRGNVCFCTRELEVWFLRVLCVVGESCSSYTCAACKRYALASVMEGKRGNMYLLGV